MRRSFRAGERGAVSAMVAVLVAAIFFSLGLVVDGGRALGALTEAQDIADNAARAGTQVVDLEAWRDGGRPVIGARGDVNAVVDQFMTSSGLAQRVDSWAVIDSTGPDADVTVTVEVVITPPSFFLPARTVTAVGTSSALDGVDAP